MSDIIFPCSKCGKDIQVDEQFKGQSIVCPICNKETVIPLTQPKQTRLTVAPHEKPTAPAPLHPQPVQTKKKGGTALDKTVATARRRKITNAIIVVALLIALPVIGYKFFPDMMHSVVGKYHSMRGETNATDVATNTVATAPTNAIPVVTNVPPPEWNIAISDIEIPAIKAQGSIAGKEFRVDVARLDKNILYLRQGTNAVPEMEFQVFTGLRATDTVDGKFWNIPVTQKAGALTVVKRWTPNPAYAPKQLNFGGGGYALRLEFGTPSGGKTPGKIYLSLQDPEKSFVAGTFVALPAPAVTSITAQPGAPVGNPQTAGQPGSQGSQPRGLTPAQRAARPATSAQPVDQKFNDIYNHK
ncbi:MAG: hypothetical protein JWN25_1358 [Verrucomicrobiales bacterium]|nr:hypothetical protein [Verrucomicrobiales bacterium]